MNKAALALAAAGLLSVLQGSAAAADCGELESVAGLVFRQETGNVTLSWPGHPRESFVVLWRPEVSVSAQWIELTNQLRASLSTNQTSFHDEGAFMRGPAMLTNANLADFYRVLLIPDFWFDMDGVELRGGRNSGEDFLPFYDGSKETGGMLKPQVSLIVDGELSSGDETSIERINFGTPKKPQWVYSRGLWFQHDLLSNGWHTLQLSATLQLNTFVGAWSWSVTLTNKPLRVWITNEISFPDFLPFLQGSNYTFAVRSATPRVGWRMDVRDAKGRLLASQTGRTTNGEIRWTWDMRDKKGRLYGTLGDEWYVLSTITTWPLDDERKGGERLMEKSPGKRNDWRAERLGRGFIRKRLSLEEAREKVIYDVESPFESKVPLRPWVLVTSPK